MIKSTLSRSFRLMVAAVFLNALFVASMAFTQHQHHEKLTEQEVKFNLRSTRNGNWSDPNTWDLKRVPQKGDRVLISRMTNVRYDAQSPDIIRLIQVVGTLDFARDQNTLLNVGILKVQDSDSCSESGFACDFSHVNPKGEPASKGHAHKKERIPQLLVGTPRFPIPAKYEAQIRLHFLEGMDPDDAPAIACCSARMEIHGAPMTRTWSKLNRDSEAGTNIISVEDELNGWRVGDEVIITASARTQNGFGTFREGVENGKAPQTEKRFIQSINGKTLKLDKPLNHKHSGSGEFRSELANLSRNVIVESADPKGKRGHTLFHRFSQGSISYARFAHLGKEGVLGRYPIHFHLAGTTMRGSSVCGVSIVDSHNRFVTIHGTQYLIVRDCVGYQSVGHGYFLEDGTEVFNLLDRNLAVHSYTGKRMKGQALPFDPNDGAGFWWANGRNTITRNVTVENDEYGYRFDIQKRSNFDPILPIYHTDGTEKKVDVRTIAISRFDNNEARAEGFYGMVVAANGNDQPDSGIRSQAMLDRIRSIDWTAPDTRHPHRIRNLKISGAHYAFRPHSPSMWIEQLRIDSAVYGIYRPCFENQVYQNLHLSRLGPEPFNRGMDDASAQVGSVTVDGLRLDNLKRGNQRHPFIHMTDNALSKGAECHFRRIVIDDPVGRRPLFNLGGSQLVDPFVSTSVPYFVHDHFGKGRDAKIVSIKAKDLMQSGEKYVESRPITGDESRIAEVVDVPWPKLLDPVDDLAPATVITKVEHSDSAIRVFGTTHDNGRIEWVKVNGKNAQLTKIQDGVVDWQIQLGPKIDSIRAFAKDSANNIESVPHQVQLQVALNANRKR